MAMKAWYFVCEIGRSGCRNLLLLYFLAGVASAQTWTQKSPATSPSARQAPVMAYDPVHSQVVLFGGTNSSGVLNDTWVWDGTTWTQKLPTTSPSARSNGVMVYDAAHSQIVLFGGQGINGPGQPIYNDTWTWDGSTWAQKSPATSPTARSFDAMTYDSVRSQVVLFGGFALPSGDGDVNDTWVWDGTTWTKLSPQTSPPVSDGSQMVFDSALGQAILFEGGGAVFYNDVWAWDGTTWTKKSPASSPPGRTGLSLGYDTAHNQVLMFGGTNASPARFGDTWIWDGTLWMQQTPTTSPSARAFAAMAYDSVHSQIVMFGGVTTGSTTVNDTWVWTGASTAAVPTITSVNSAGAFGAFSTVTSGTWIEIYGTDLGPSTPVNWAGSDFQGNNAPTSIGGVEVKIGGQAAFSDYVSSTQVNAQLPSNIPTGPTQITVTNGTMPSAPYNITVNLTQPGMLAPPSFKVGANQYVVAQFTDGTYVLPPGAIAGVPSRQAKPGETIIIYGIGFGSVSPNIPAGQIATVSNQLAQSFQILFGTATAGLGYYGLAPNYVGLYQFNVVVPAVADNDLVPFSFTLGGAPGSQTLYTAVHH
jgi:uncharacterized protein (TIGR03437 family)